MLISPTFLKSLGRADIKEGDVFYYFRADKVWEGKVKNVFRGASEFYQVKFDKSINNLAIFGTKAAAIAAHRQDVESEIEDIEFKMNLLQTRLDFIKEIKF